MTVVAEPTYDQGVLYGRLLQRVDSHDRAFERIESGLGKMSEALVELSAELREQRAGAHAVQSVNESSWSMRERVLAAVTALALVATPIVSLVVH